MSERQEEHVGERWRRTIVFAVATATISLVGPGGLSASAQRGLDYECRLAATKLGDEIAVTLRLLTDQARDDWRIRLYHEDELIFSKVRITNARGNLKVVRVVPNLPGRDDLASRARHLESGTICEVESRI
jgi:hypothetical protein